MDPKALDLFLEAALTELRSERPALAKISKLTAMLADAEARFDSRKVVQTKYPKRR